MMNNSEFTKDEIRTMLAIVTTLERIPYGELNTFLGSETINGMYSLSGKLKEMCGIHYHNEPDWDEA